MTPETKPMHYRGVVCGYCHQPIPVPGNVEKIVRGETEPNPHDHGPRAFNVRCRACEREMPYSMSDVVEFTGSPRPRSMRTQNSLLRHAVGAGRV